MEALSSTLRAEDAGLVVVVIAGVLQVTALVLVDVIVMSLKLMVR